MNRITLGLAAASTLALAACGGNDTPDTAATTDDTAAVDVTLPSGNEFPTVQPDARTNVKYAGTYSQPAGSGMRSITLNDDDTYSMTDETGKQTRGTYNWYDDNSRILIKNGGQNEVYAIADGALYRMADANAPTDGAMTESQTYRRVIGPGGPMGSSGTSDAAPRTSTTAAATPTPQ